jgi:hypothetical protein
MRRNRPGLPAVALAVAVALLLALTQVALAVGAPPPGAAAEESPAVAAETAGTGTDAVVVRNETNTTNYLAIPSETVERERFGNETLDVAGTIAADATRLHGRHESRTFSRSFSDADESARVALVRNETVHIETRIEELKQRQRRALAAFNDGSIDAHRLLRRLVAVHVEARQLERRLRAVRRASQRAVGFRLPNDLLTRIDNFRAELVPVRGRVRAHVGRVMDGSHNSTSVYVLTSQQGLVLGTVDDRTFFREAYLADSRRPGAPDQFEDGELRRISVANQRAAELYPWTYSIPPPPSVRAFGDSSVYNVSDTHPHGELVAYLDGATEDAYREFQIKRLATLPTRNITASNGTLRLRVDRTHATGPMRLSVLRAATDRPVDATVTVNGQTVGTTGSDGQLWTVAPHDAVRIEARTAAGDVVRVQFFAR